MHFFDGFIKEWNRGKSMKNPLLLERGNRGE